MKLTFLLLLPLFTFAQYPQKMVIQGKTVVAIDTNQTNRINEAFCDLKALQVYKNDCDSVTAELTKIVAIERKMVLQRDTVNVLNNAIIESKNKRIVRLEKTGRWKGYGIKILIGIALAEAVVILIK